MSNIYLKVNIEKNWCSQNFDFLNLKNLSPGHFSGAQLTQISLNFQTFCSNLKIIGLRAKTCVAFQLFQVWMELWRFKVKSPCILLKKNIMENPTVFERRTLCFSSYKNSKLKVKLWWDGAYKIKKRSYLYRLFCPKKIFLTFMF